MSKAGTNVFTYLYRSIDQSDASRSIQIFQPAFNRNAGQNDLTHPCSQLNSFDIVLVLSCIRHRTSKVTSRIFTDNATQVYKLNVAIYTPLNNFIFAIVYFFDENRTTAFLSHISRVLQSQYHSPSLMQSTRNHLRILQHVFSYFCNTIM